MGQFRLVVQKPFPGLHNSPPTFSSKCFVFDPTIGSFPHESLQFHVGLINRKFIVPLSLTLSKPQTHRSPPNFLYYQVRTSSRLSHIPCRSDLLKLHFDFTPNSHCCSAFFLMLARFMLTRLIYIHTYTFWK